MVEPGGSTPAEYVNNVSLLMVDLAENSFTMAATAKSGGTLPVKRLSTKLNQSKLTEDKRVFYYGTDYLPMATKDLLQAIETKVGTSTAAWMSGYARITANLAGESMPGADFPPRYVVASPLYVERSTPPGTP